MNLLVSDTTTQFIYYKRGKEESIKDLNKDFIPVG